MYGPAQRYYWGSVSYLWLIFIGDLSREFTPWSQTIPTRSCTPTISYDAAYDTGTVPWIVDCEHKVFSSNIISTAIAWACNINYCITIVVTSCWAILELRVKTTAMLNQVAMPLTLLWSKSCNIFYYFKVYHFITLHPLSAIRIDITSISME